MESALQCEICFSRYDIDVRKPLILYPCSHTFCKDCIQQFQSNSCPECRQVIRSNSTNYIVMKLLNRSLLPTTPLTVPRRNCFSRAWQSFKQLTDRQKSNQ